MNRIANARGPPSHAIERMGRREAGLIRPRRSERIGTEEKTPVDDFVLDVEVVIDASPRALAPCLTDDGCAGTCASACASK
jgi:FxLD family lantipeptide